MMDPNISAKIEGCTYLPGLHVRQRCVFCNGLEDPAPFPDPVPIKDLT